MYGIQDNMGTRSRSPFSSSTLLNLITEKLNSHIYTFYGCVAKHSQQQENDQFSFQGVTNNKIDITRSQAGWPSGQGARLRFRVQVLLCQPALASQGSDSAISRNISVYCQGPNQHHQPELKKVTTYLQFQCFTLFFSFVSHTKMSFFCCFLPKTNNLIDTENNPQREKRLKLT